MKNDAFYIALRQEDPLFLDGAMGTMLQASGMPPGVSPEKFCLANPDILRGIHAAYIDAGASIITTCTFGANPLKLPPDMDALKTSRELARIARQAADEGAARVGRPVFVAGDVGPTGQFSQPLGSIAPEDMLAGFGRQIDGLAQGGCDLIFMETQFDLAETRLAVVAARKVCRLPLMASMTFEHGLSLTGSTPEIFAATMLNLGVDVIGSNCSLGPDEMAPVLEAILAAGVPCAMAEPNAGLPVLRDGQTVFPLDPDSFAEKTARFAAMGVKLLGGCCGTTPDHIAALRQAAGAISVPVRPQPAPGQVCLTSRSRLLRIGAGQPLAVIGERINPTGKPALAEELAKGKFGLAIAYADEQVDAGARALDVNVGAHQVDETKVLPELVQKLASRLDIPLVLDSASREAILAALPFYPGSCLVNSISGGGERMEKLGVACRDYGAPFVLLPIAGARLPKLASERIAIIEKLVAKALDLGISRRLVLVDILAMAISADSQSAVECLELARWCRKEGFATTVGLSNISFGLPARELLNSVFLCMGRGAGLDSCIANPCIPRFGEARDAINVLDGFDRDAENFIGSYHAWQAMGQASGGRAEAGKAKSLYEAVLQGDSESINDMVDRELAAGADPMALVNDALIPAITEVGALYERREYFLPQLIRSAETMRLGFARLKPLLEASHGPEKRPVVVMATVEGDIHDIGKNIVSLLLGNHGFEVVDAGKDVPAAEIVARAENSNASLIGLSALMTTTMIRMKDTIRLIRERNLPIKVMVGGAAVTREFADSIGADAYCDDAMDTVRAAKAFIALEKEA